MTNAADVQSPTTKVKLIRQEKFIRFSGVVMMISPFINFALSIAPVQNVGDKTTLPVLWSLAKSINSIHWLLWAASFVVGTMMLKGRRSSWISVLAILGIFIVFDFLNLKKNLARGWEQPLTSIAFNLFIFILVYVQEFRQSSQARPKPIRQPQPAPAQTEAKIAPQVPLPVRPEPKIAPQVQSPPPRPEAKIVPQVPVQPIRPEVKPAHPVSTSPTLQTRVATQQAQPPTEDFRLPPLPNLVGHVIHFDGMGPWARIVNLDQKELYLRGFREPPPMLTSRAVEIDIGQETYRLRMTSRQGQLYTFRFEAVQKFKLRLVS